MATQSTLLNESLEMITENGSRNKPERHLRTEFDRQCEAKKREKQRCPNLLNSIELSSNFQVQHYLYTMSESTRVVLTLVCVRVSKTLSKKDYKPFPLPTPKT